MRQLTLLQRQRITLSLFFTVALGAVFTVATPAFVPWQVVDNKRAQALDQQRRQGKDFHVVENHHRRRRGTAPNSEHSTAAEEDPSTSPATPSTLSHQGLIIPLLTDRSKLRPSLGSEAEEQTSRSGSGVTDQQEQQDEDSATTSQPTKRKRRRRRKRTMVNEGWQELTGRTAREEKMKQGGQSTTENNTTLASAVEEVGENGGKELSWARKP
ncbi:hypothetical protein BGZ94_001232 [Podila epigama]|nr:hypothetical protein BGZ94_001232 [Podila epigama]